MFRLHTEAGSNFRWHSYWRTYGPCTAACKQKLKLAGLHMHQAADHMWLQGIQSCPPSPPRSLQPEQNENLCQRFEGPRTAGNP